MKTNKRILVAIATVLFTGANTSMSAKSWRIHNVAIYKPHFTSINDAMASENVQDGDTLYLDPGSTISETQNVTKRVTIIGPGYFMQERSYGIATINNSIYMKAEGSKLEGVYVNRIYIAASQVTIERCRLWYGIRASGNNAQMATIRQCYLMNCDNNIEIRGGGKQDVQSALWRIEGCQISGYYNNSIHDLYQAVIANNYIRNTYNNSTQILGNLSDCIITDNIIHKTHENYKNNIYSGLTNCTLQNNILSCEESVATDFPNNIFLGSSDVSNVATLTGNDLFQLVDGSPAKGNASDGTDIGPTGGQCPYVSNGRPYGMPWYPTSIVATAPKDGKVNVNIKIQVQDE